MASSNSLSTLLYGGLPPDVPEPPILNSFTARTKVAPYPRGPHVYSHPYSRVLDSRLGRALFEPKMIPQLTRRLSKAQHLLSILAFANIALLCVVAANHISFPLNLEAMETTVLEHVRRAMTGQPIYIEPSAQFAPLAYNPLYYYLCAFFAKFMGLSLATLREVTLLGTIGCGWLLYRITARETRSPWWGFMTLGLFAGSYQALDSYYDVGHRDTWLIFLVLAGCYLIGYSESGVRDVLGILLSWWLRFG